MCAVAILITAWGLLPGDLNLLINRFRSLSSSPRGVSVVLRFIVKSSPIACVSEITSISKSSFAFLDRSTWIPCSFAVVVSIHESNFNRYLFFVHVPSRLRRVFALSSCGFFDDSRSASMNVSSWIVSAFNLQTHGIQLSLRLYSHQLIFFSLFQGFSE